MLFREKVKTGILLIVFLTIAFPVIAGSLLNGYTSFKYVNIPLHSGVEVAGGVIAIVISMIFYIKYSKDYHLTHFNWSTTALLAMGIMDIFHGIVMPGELFVWLHSCAVLFGGILFMTVWLKDRYVSKNFYKLIPVSIIVFSVLFCSVFLIFPGFVPRMFNIDGTFSTTAKFLNIIGGIGFFIASLKFVKKYLNTQNGDELLFAGHTMLFGIAGVLFATSVIWDMQWWLWHFLRLSAYCIALYFLYIEFNYELKLIEKTNDQLNRANKKIKKYLDIVDKNVITSSTDIYGNISNVSEAFCKISGYTKEELIGRNHRIIKHPDEREDLYFNMWQTLNKNDIWSGEIKNRKKDGSHYWVYATINPVFDEEGKKTGYTAIRQDITDKKRVELLSVTDGLTGIYNRRYFNELFPNIINITKRKNELLCFLMIDIDFFKQYNDTYGHQKGDDVLISVSKTINDSLNRGDDYCFRLGGEEFGVIFKTDTKEDAFNFAKLIKDNIEDLKIEHIKSMAGDYVTVSMGLICKNAKDINSMEEIYKQADENLYKAKERGRNNIVSNFE